MAQDQIQPPSHIRQLLRANLFGMLAASPLILGVAMQGSVATAQANPPVSQELQAMDCQWWDYVTAFAYEDYAIFSDAQLADPMDELKYRLDYDNYHEFSAGRALLDAVFSGIDAGEPVHAARDGIATLCHSFPADAVHPSNIYAPMLGETL